MTTDKIRRLLKFPASRHQGLTAHIQIRMLAGSREIQPGIMDLPAKRRPRS